MTTEHHDLWAINGKLYDMHPFADRHPGGKHFLMIGKGRDCTELFNSVHALSKVDFELLLAKFELKGQAPINKPLFDFSAKSKFWSELKQQVNQYFRDEIKTHYKASVPYWIASAAMLAVMIGLTIWWIQTANIALGFINGLLVTLFGFFVMHSASHGALSKYSCINYGITVLWCHYVWWSGWIWLQHHVYGHHSYTGILGKDPDVRNLVPFARKHVDQKLQKFSKYQCWLPVFVQTFLPNQFIGQTLIYFTSFKRRKLFGMPLTFPEFPVWEWIYEIMSVISFIVVFLIPFHQHGTSFFPSLFAYWTGLGVMYWAIVFPNHDTIGAHEQFDGVFNTRSNESWLKQDWAALQLLHSSNFNLPWILGYLSGGMNYQIEHHLFPAVHPMHYPALSKIVREVAAKYQLPYCCYKTWFHAFQAHLKLLSVFSKAPKLDNMKAA